MSLDWRGLSRRLLAGIGVGLLGACFGGAFVQGLPCSTDEDCGPEYTCDDGLCGGPGGRSLCGNGLLEEGEECDDGDLEGRDDCTPECRHNVCGDGHFGPDEECDEGSANGGGSCSLDCVVTGCGNGILNEGEECDDGNRSNDDDCTEECKEPECGDGLISPGEECDDGDTDEGDACTPACTLSVCGDGFVGIGEECDDGDTQEGDACTPICRLSVCGDGFVGIGEECDDGNLGEGDPCTPECTVVALCDDGVLSGGETGVDCGGICVEVNPNNQDDIDGQCGSGDGCLVNGDCTAGVCGQNDTCEVCPGDPPVYDPADLGYNSCQSCLVEQCCMDLVACMQDISGCVCWFNCVSSTASVKPCMDTCGNGNVGTVYSCMNAACGADMSSMNCAPP